MKAVIYESYGDPQVLKVADVPKPVIKENEVLIKVKASGVNPVDTYFRKGIRQVNSFPHIPHFDLAGEVAEVGATVTTIKVGDRVWATNAKEASAEYAAVPADLVFPLPNELHFQDGAALAMPFMTAYLSLFNRGQLKEDETVLIYGGAGAVGHAAIQLAKKNGATVIATASNQEKAKIVKEVGADEVIVYTSEDLVEKVMQFTNQKGVSLILDMSLSENLEKDLEIITIGGRIITIGSPANNTPPLLWRQLNMKHASLIGVFLFTAPLKELLTAGNAISEGFASGHFQSHIGKVVPFHSPEKAHAALESKEFDGRIILNHELSI
ncbi:NADPH:quinone reductase [Halalkalibacter krulwichiae]|uniref:Quinone oxidoreductase 1 n=1 Tax=Halalkalibacter krulwichiae TaxID=199441 RepID=A0A1X9M6G4_9BACI|nr:NADPH:quinone reductase [Halalkalibacter krulwichiae]ARK29026.1 Quinone oxidoreductase 1 [Halalkalibacter krulwichiae]